MNLSYIKIYGEEMLAMIEPFTDVEKGRLFVGMMKYSVSGEEPQFSGNERFIWGAIRRKIDIDAMAYGNTVEANRMNGKKGGRGKKKITSENPVDLSETLKSTGFSKNPENPMGLAKNEKSQEQEQEQEQHERATLALPVHCAVTEQEKKRERVPYQEIKDNFNQICTQLATIKSMEDTRKRKTAAIFKKIGYDGLISLFIQVNESDFLCGRGKSGWVATYDWIIKLENATKILEGNYENVERMQSISENQGNGFINGGCHGQNDRGFVGHAKEVFSSYEFLENNLGLGALGEGSEEWND